MWWEERYWLLLNVEWEAGRAPLVTVAQWVAARLSSLLMTLSLGWGGNRWDYLSPNLCLLSSYSTPPSCACCPFLTLFFHLLSHLHNLSLSCDYRSLHLSVPPHCFFYGFSSLFLPRCPPPPPWSWMEVTERCSGLRKDLFSTAPASPPTCLTPCSPLLSSPFTFSFLQLPLFNIDPTTHWQPHLTYTF